MIGNSHHWVSRFFFWMGLLLLQTSQAARALPDQNPSIDYWKKEILEVWRQKILKNKGMYTWSTQHSGMRVFQSWITLLESHRNSPRYQRQRIGLELEKYVVNSNLQPLGVVGTSIPLPGYSKADFDMTLLPCVSLIGLYIDDRLLLTNLTLTHLLKNITQLWGQETKAYFNLLNMQFPETENHLFMIESTRYLINQYIYENKRNLPEITALKDSLTRLGFNVDNANGSLAQHIKKLCQRIFKQGFFEHNSRVYQRFTVHSLNNLYSFASDTNLRRAAEVVLDYTSVKFAFQSLNSVRFGPYRRNAKKFLDERAWQYDQMGSFFGVQSGKFPWPKAEILKYWSESSGHASMALFSCLLKYRVPDLVLEYMREIRESYWVQMQNLHEVEGKLQSSPEFYFIHQDFMVSAGGRYQFYQGSNAPLDVKGVLGKTSPWVYDFISRKSSLYLNISGTDASSLPIVTYKGSFWNTNQLAVYGPLIYGFSTLVENENEWPQEISPSIPLKKIKEMGSRYFFMKVYEVQKPSGFLVLTKVRARKHLFFSHSKGSRGTIEYIPANDQSWEKIYQERNFQKWFNQGFYYPLEFGHVVQLNSKYGPQSSGFKKIFLLNSPLEDNLNQAQKWKPPEFNSWPLLRVTTWERPNQKKIKALTQQDGQLWCHSQSGENTLYIDFRWWWKPEKTILQNHRN